MLSQFEQHLGLPAVQPDLAKYAEGQIMVRPADQKQSISRFAFI